MVSDISEIRVFLADFRITGKRLAYEHRHTSGCQYIFGGTSDSWKYICFAGYQTFKRGEALVMEDGCVTTLITAAKETTATKRFVIYFLSPRTPSCPLFCPSGNQALIFLNRSPINLKDWTTAYFE